MVKEIYSHHPHHIIDTTTNNYFVNRVEKVDDQLKKTSPPPMVATTTTSVTSPIFNSMTVVQTSTPSSSNSSSNSSNNDINNNKATVETTTTNGQFESNKIKLNIQNSRPTLQQHQTSGGGGSASSTLKLIIQKQDFAVQVSKDEIVSQTGMMMSRAPVVKVVQGSNMNAGNFGGRAKKSIDVIDNEYTKGISFFVLLLIVVIFNFFN